jgi:hypothetical protein
MPLLLTMGEDPNPKPPSNTLVSAPAVTPATFPVMAKIPDLVLITCGGNALAPSGG